MFRRFFSRDEATRTPDPYVPNVVRYQLRYIPIFKNRLRVQRYYISHKCQRKEKIFSSFSWIYKIKLVPLHPLFVIEDLYGYLIT